MARRRSSYYDDYWPRYSTTSPIEVKGGLKAKSQRGKFVENWWAERWIKALRSLMDSGRLSRGRSYARRGQVIEIDIAPGHISSRVQGSRRSPYKVDIRLLPLTDRQWDKVFDALAEQAIFAAQLLNGEMPQEIDRVFDAVDVPLFPTSQGDLNTECSCPDWANPCKHIAAVYYLMGERFDQDPFLLFELRGRGKTAVAAALRERRGHDTEYEDLAADRMADAPEATEAAALDHCLDRYWKLGPEAAQVVVRITPPQVNMALLKRMGVPEFVSLHSFWNQMQRVYDGVTNRALDVAFADAES